MANADPFGWTAPLASAKRFGGSLACSVASLCGCALPVVGAPAAPPGPAPAITAIALERHCFGCTTESVLVLRREGTATLTIPGSERAGTAEATAAGAVRVQDFDALARLAVSQGFFDLAAVYEDPEIRDGPSTTTRITRGGVDKQVFRRDAAGPAPLKTLEAAIDSLQARIRFVPERR